MSDHPNPTAIVEMPGVKFVVEKDDTWQSIGMTVVLVLAIYAGIKLINRLFKNDTPNKKVARTRTNNPL